MRKLLFGAAIACMIAGVVIANERTKADVAPTSVQHESTVGTVPGTDLDRFAKKCSFNSDCPYGKCKSGSCGGCSFDSDCKGWGKCKSGSCGGCSFSSDCKGFGGCSGGRCKKSPY